MEFIKKNTVIFVSISILLILSIVLTVFALMPNMLMSHSTEMGTNKYNKEIVKEEKEGIANLLADGRYKCCMKEPCARCFAKEQYHDRELVCDCLEDIMNEKHPCGECLGEILEGGGNPLIAEYFATSIAEKLGEQYLQTLKQIISEQYENMPVEKQI